MPQYANRPALGDELGRRAEHTRTTAADGPLPLHGTPLRPSDVPLRLAGDAVRRAAAEPGHALPAVHRGALEAQHEADLGTVRIHTGAAADQASRLLGARAYTIGADVYLSDAGARLAPTEQRQLLAHETTHVLQQGAERRPLPEALPLGPATGGLEAEARGVGRRRRSRPARPAAVQVQRDITGTSTKAEIPLGTMKIDFKKVDGTDAGDVARERGKITFTPDAAAPESNELHFVQIVRTVDVATGKDHDFTGTSEAPRNKMMTKEDTAKGVVPGFYVDQTAKSLTPRSAKTDPTVLPYVDAMRTVPQQVGKHTKAGDTDAVLNDRPGSDAAIRFKFVSSVKAHDTGTWYGSVLWGFEIALDAKGVPTIKGEYKQFRADRGATTDAAVKAFDEFYKNPGASTAP
jgi:Domain of unknown function (DUF4157)